ncbi:hypothetical protein HDV00_008630 [Rhizophlyctis rosea]|nr:hypothetical protein HDV00_008630 [Rhizophlyctis rosea]
MLESIRNKLDSLKHPLLGKKNTSASSDADDIPAEKQVPSNGIIQRTDPSADRCLAPATSPNTDAPLTTAAVMTIPPTAATLTVTPGTVLTSTEIKALHAYTGNDSLRINSKLRAGEQPHLVAPHLLTAIQKRTQHPHQTLYRGENHLSFTILPNEEGPMRVTFAAFTSTSRNWYIASRFGQHQLVFRGVSGGKVGRYRHWWWLNEEEVIILPGTVFVVTSWVRRLEGLKVKHFVELQPDGVGGVY